MRYRAGEQALSDAFPGKLLFRRKEEFCEECTSKRRNQARQPTFASGKPTGEGRMSRESDKREKIEKGEGPAAINGGGTI